MRAIHRRLVSLAVAAVIASLAPAAVHGSTVALPTLRPVADGSRDAAVQIRGVTLAFDAIDEALASADTTSYLQNQQRLAGRYHALLTDMPAAFASMTSLSISVRARTVGASDDQTSLYAQLVAADEATTLSAEVLVGTNIGASGWATVADKAFGGLSAGTKATWDGARLRLRWAYTQVGSADSTQSRVTAVELNGTYDTGGTPPPPPPGDTDPPALSSAAVDASTLTLTYDEALDPASVPGTSAFTARVNGGQRGVSGVGVSGARVTVTLASPVVPTDGVTLSYSVPGTSPVQDAAGNDAPGFTDAAVDNVTSSPPPPPPPGGSLTFTPSEDAQVKSSSATANYGSLTTIRLREENGGTSYRSYLKFTVAGLTAPVSAVKLRLYVTDASPDSGSVHGVTSGWSQGTITYANAPAIGGTVLGTAGSTTVGQWVDINLSPSAVSGNGVVAFGLRSGSTNSAIFSSREGTNPPQLVVTQQSGPPPVDSTPPTLSTAAVNGATLTLTYDETLDGASVPAASDYAVSVGGSGRSVSTVGVSGTKVTLTLASAVTSADAVTVSYTPGTNPVQDPTGNDAVALSDRAVTNSTPPPPPPGGVAIASGNEITDAVRAAGIQGDGRLADSSFGIWEAATNLDPNGGFENGSTAGWSAVGGSIVNAAEPSRFGALAGKVVTTAAGDRVEKSVVGLAASTTYSRSLWIHRTETSATLTVSVLDASGAGTLASATVPATLGWSRVVLRPRTQSGQTQLTTRIGASLGGITYHLDGAQLERNVVATPYVETNGSIATRGPSKVSVSGTPVGPSQGWVAVRIRFGWDSTAPFSPDPGIVDMSASNNDALFCYWDEATHTFHLERHRNGAGTTAASAAQTFSAGAVKTVIFAWTATDVRISVDGGAFVGTGNTTIPGQATLHLGSDQVQGNGANRQADSDYLWAAGGSGTLTTADAATIHGFGDTDHPQGDFPGSPTFAWSAD